jgi:hypothetical protein
MIVSNDFDGDTCDALAEKLVMLATKDEVLTHREILMAHMGAMCCTLAAISCKGCRELAAQFVKSELPELVRGALEEAAKHYGNPPPPSDHVH